MSVLDRVWDRVWTGARFVFWCRRGRGHWNHGRDRAAPRLRKRRPLSVAVGSGLQRDPRGRVRSRLVEPGGPSVRGRLRGPNHGGPNFRLLARQSTRSGLRVFPPPSLHTASVLGDGGANRAGYIASAMLCSALVRHVDNAWLFSLRIGLVTGLVTAAGITVNPFIGVLRRQSGRAALGRFLESGWCCAGLFFSRCSIGRPSWTYRCVREMR